MTKLRAQLNRRSLLAGVALIAAPAVLGRSLARAQGRGLVIVSWGGTYAEAVETAFLKPFTNDTGVPVTVASGPDMARVRAQVRTGNIDWDLLDGPGPMITAGEREGTWEALDQIDRQYVGYGSRRIPGERYRATTFMLEALGSIRSATRPGGTQPISWSFGTPSASPDEEDFVLASSKTSRWP